MRPSTSGLLLAVALTLGATPALAQGNATSTTLSIGVDYAEGEYGGDETTSTLSLPLTVKFDSEAWLLRATIPYVWAEGTFSRDLGATVGGRAARSTETRTESGIGDLVVGVFHHLLNTPGGLSVDVGVKAKFATADDDKELITTGEDDYSLQADAFQAWRRVMLFGTLGYTRKGDPPGADFRNPLYGTLGASTLVGKGDSVGVAWDFRQKVTRHGDPISELTLFYTHRLDRTDRLQFYALQGLADGSPDFGGGVVFSRTY